MQTFLPYPSFIDSARCLDVKRLGKQRVECKQLLLALGVPVGEHQPKRSSWVTHPATRMWRRHELTLAHYGAVMCREWRERGYRDVLLDQFKVAYDWLQGECKGLAYPNWIGYDAFHSSHRSNLLRKNMAWYGRFGWSEPSDLAYFWPVEMEAVS